MTQKNDVIVCHYAEIGLKGKNRKIFEEKLVENIKKTLQKGFLKQARRISGRILLELKEEVNEKEKKEIKEKLRNVFGIAYFAFSQVCGQEISAIKEKAVEMLKKIEFKTFCIRAKRSEKSFPLTSQEINEQVGEEIINWFQASGLKFQVKVNLEKPDITSFIEIANKNAFLYLEKVPGPGGLPVGVSGKAVSLLSGGIDSPVASFYAQKRGIELIFLHFHALPYVSRASLEKVEEIVEVLNKHQFSAKLYLIPFSDIQKEILLKTKVSLRVVLYRRFMFKIAEILAKKEKAKVLVTGENVGQVAFQTLENLAVIEQAVDLPVLRPLICQDKQDIIEKAKEIGTYDISILPHQDCCSRFLPKRPATKANLAEVKKEERKLALKILIDEAVKKAEIRKVLQRS